VRVVLLLVFTSYFELEIYSISNTSQTLAVQQ